jgi:hypothetical protein
MISDPDKMSADFHIYPPAYNSPLTSFYKREPGDLHITSTERWSVRNGVLTEGPYPLKSDYVEIIEESGALRVWQDDSQYLPCSMEGNILDAIVTDAQSSLIDDASGADNTGVADQSDNTSNGSNGNELLNSDDRSAAGGGAMGLSFIQVVLLLLLIVVRRFPDFRPVSVRNEVHE